MKASWWNAFALVHLSWVIGFHPSPGNMNHPDCPLQTRGVEALKRPDQGRGSGRGGFETPPPHPQLGRIPPGAHRIKGWGHPPGERPAFPWCLCRSLERPPTPSSGPRSTGPPFRGTRWTPPPTGPTRARSDKEANRAPGCLQWMGTEPPLGYRQTNRGARRDPCCR